LSVEVVVETHSISVDNERGVASGWLPSGLSERGRALAQELGARRRSDNITAVYTSDLTRAVETAEIAFGGSGIPIHRDWRLRECNYGALNGMTSAQLTAERDLRIDDPYPKGESWRATLARVKDCLDGLATRHNGERILVIGHVATRWALDHYVDGVPVEELVRAPFSWREGWEYVYPRPCSCLPTPRTMDGNGGSETTSS
jgi:2,3-bisphosphoglycerate-dependent phosphoglycerate mutase